MATTYLSGKIHTITLAHGTDKAFYVEIDDGRWTSDRNGYFWISRKLCEISEPNECGWCDILVPAWVFNKNRVDYHRVRDINWNGVKYQ